MKVLLKVWCIPAFLVLIIPMVLLAIPFGFDKTIGEALDWLQK